MNRDTLIRHLENGLIHYHNLCLFIRWSAQSAFTDFGRESLITLRLNYNLPVAISVLVPLHLSIRIHSRIKAGQFLSTDPFVSQAARNLTASRSTSVTSFKSSMIRSRSCSRSLVRGSTCSDRIRPLNA